jgi:nucleoside-diphosphate-sugar epimerase
VRIQITGSQGFIGQSVGRYATRQGHTVLGIGRSSQPSHAWSGQYVQAEVGQTDLSRIIRRFSPDTVVPAAGPASMQNSLRAPIDDVRGPGVAWANLLDSVR